MKLALLVAILTMVGCAGTMLDGRLCSIATDKDAQQDLSAIVSQVAPEDKKSVQLGLQAARLSATALCEGARYKQGGQ